MTTEPTVKTGLEKVCVVFPFAALSVCTSMQ